MKYVFSFLCSMLLSVSLLFSGEASSESYPNREVTIVGGGIIGALESYYAHLDAVKNGTKLRVRVYEKGEPFSASCTTNTAYNIVPSLTTDEILSVVPRGSELMQKLAILFSEPGGIRVDDVPGVNNTDAAVRFKEAVAIYGNDQNHDDRTQTLLQLGRMSMDLWHDLYAHADDELKMIMEESNFNPCRDPKNKDTVLHDGYRIDIIYGIPNAVKRANGMKATYEQLGYKNCKVLSPKEVMTIDPSLTEFALAHSKKGENQELGWDDDSVALWRPGGCIDTNAFLPKFYAYLNKVMGTYTSKSGKVKDCFGLRFNREVTGVMFDNDNHVVGVKFSDGTVKHSTMSPANSSYVFCPGEAVGTLSKLGFQEPAYAGFAGPSLFINIPLTADQLAKYKNFSHCMEVHKEGIVLAWQARFKQDKIFIGVAGTKSFYADLLPKKNEAFAKNRHLVQLNMINDVLPEMMSLALGYNTKGKTLGQADLDALEEKEILQRWVGRRAVAYDGFPTLGALYSKGKKVTNARCTTHLGSGGVSFAPASVKLSRSSNANIQDGFIAKVLNYADSRRTPDAKNAATGNSSL